MTTRGFIYLAAPYSHPAEVVRAQRYREITQYAAKLMAQGFSVFSPITHSHKLARFLPAMMRDSHEFWMSMDLPILERASEVCVLMLPGWDVSRGVQHEIEHATEHGISVWYSDPALVVGGMRLAS